MSRAVVSHLSQQGVFSIVMECCCGSDLSCRMYSQQHDWTPQGVVWAEDVSVWAALCCWHRPGPGWEPRQCVQCHRAPVSLPCPGECSMDGLQYKSCNQVCQRHAVECTLSGGSSSRIKNWPPDRSLPQEGLVLGAWKEWQLLFAQSGPGPSDLSSGLSHIH